MKVDNRNKLGYKISVRVALYIIISAVFIFVYTLLAYIILRETGAINIIEYSPINGSTVLSINSSLYIWAISIFCLWLISLLIVCIYIKKAITKALEPIYDVVTVTRNLANGNRDTRIEI